MNILVIADKTLKDIIFLEPCIREIKNKSKDSNIFLVYLNRFHLIVKNWDFVDEYIKIPDNIGFFGKWTLISELRRVRFDKIVDFRRDNNPYIFRKLLHFGTYSCFLQKKSINYDDLYFYVMRQIQFEISELLPRWHFPPGHSCKLGKVRSPLIGIVPFSETGDVKIEVFLYIVSEFVKKYKGSVVLLGNKKFLNRSKAFEVFEDVFNIIDREDINDAAFVLKYCNAVIGVDSDYIFLSQIFNKNVIMINKSDLSEFKGFFQNITQNIEKDILKKLDNILIESYD